MYAVIMGNGRVGRNLAIKLINTGNDVTLIDSDENSCSIAASELDALVICGNATNTKILEEANVNEADVFVAATGNDEANLLASILVREYKSPKVIARVSNPDHEEAFKKIGIDHVISPELTAVSYLEKLITRPKVADLIICGKGNAELIDITVKNKKIIGKTVGEVSPTDDYIIGAVYNGGIIIPQDDIVLEENTKISILVKSNAVKKVTNMFTG
ncbi:potassium channel family protein [Methanobacterium oryzae]|uniref:potassium channel family protein n=1 Tax=Methanobacterium oryzae TaxID=69540 RepID=UPI003D1F8DA6